MRTFTVSGSCANARAQQVSGSMVILSLMSRYAGASSAAYVNVPNTLCLALVKTVVRCGANAMWCWDDETGRVGDEGRVGRCMGEWMNAMCVDAAGMNV